MNHIFTYTYICIYNVWTFKTIFPFIKFYTVICWIDNVYHWQVFVNHNVLFSHPWYFCDWFPSGSMPLVCMGKVCPAFLSLDLILLQMVSPLDRSFNSNIFKGFTDAVPIAPILIQFSPPFSRSYTVNVTIYMFFFSFSLCSFSGGSYLLMITCGLASG